MSKLPMVLTLRQIPIIIERELLLADYTLRRDLAMKNQNKDMCSV